MGRFGPADAARWGGAAAVVLALHAAGVMLLMDHVPVAPAMPPAPEAVMLDLPPDLPPMQEAAAAPPPAAMEPPSAPLAELPPPEPPPPAAPLPEPPPPALPPVPPVAAEAVLPVPPPPPPPPPRAPPKPKPRPAVERPSAPPLREEAPRRAEAPPAEAAPGPAAPAARPPAPPFDAVPTWRSDLLGRLQRAKRYPDLARSRGDQGVATVSFTIDRGGRVLNVSLLRSAGSPSLDEEAVALVRRAEPLPRVPDEIPGATVTLTVPISFALR